jgi:membrane-bound ClpP family serine protease
MRIAQRVGGGRPVRLAGAVALLLGLALPPAPARAQEKDPGVDGLFVSVRNPITSDVVAYVKDQADSAINRSSVKKNGGTFKLVLDFNPDGIAGSSSDFGACYQLAKYLREKDVPTIAFVHAEVSRHTVLPVLACKELVMSSQAKLGPVVQPDLSVAPPEVLAYEDVAASHNLSTAVVRKMLDKELEVLEGTQNGSVKYLTRKEAEDAKGAFVVRQVAIPRGQPGSYTATDAKTFGLCTAILDSAQQVANEYHLPPTSLHADLLGGRTPVAWLIKVSGAFTSGTKDRITKQVGRAVGHPEHPANTIIFQLDCSGGDTVSAMDFATYVSKLKDNQGEHPVMTIAYVPTHAADTAAIIALGCREIVLREGADFGDFKDAVGGGYNEPDPEKTNQKVQGWMDLAREQGYSPLLVKGMVSKPLVLYLGKSTKGNDETRVLTEEDLAADRAGWNVQQLKPAGSLLVLPADKALAVKLARLVVPGKDEREGLAKLREAKGIKDGDMPEAGNDWLDEFAAFLRLWPVRFFLVMVGIICLILELKLPGAVLPGVIAALCFVLFFWASMAESWGYGITLLAVLLFLLALVLIGIEVFVVPGTGVVGISGALLLVLSLALVTLEKKPETAHDWLDVGKTVTTFALSLGGAVIAAFVVAYFLPHIPYLNRFVLKPPAEPGEDGATMLDTIKPEVAALLGSVGVAETPLRPAGKVKIGDQYVDVVAEGEFVQPGSRVQVIEIEGYRIVVKEVT